jgi:hypothetical protein
VNILGRQGPLLHLGIAGYLRAFQGLAEGPGDLAQLKRAAVAAAAEVGIGEPTRVQPHAGQVGWVQGCQGGLGVGGVGKAEGAHFAVAPALPAQPYQGVVAVPTLVGVLGEPAARGVTPPAVLDHHHVAPPGEEAGLLIPGRRRLVIRGAVEQRWEGSGQGLTVLGREMDVCRQGYAIARWDHDVALGVDLVGCRRVRFHRVHIPSSSKPTWRGSGLKAQSPVPHLSL